MLRDTWFYVKVALSLFLIALVMAIFADPAGAAKRPPPRPCVGVVVRTIEGVEYVRRKDGTACTRPPPRRW
jgi:hypothetical protein